jgi:hypothetical protein
VDGEGGAGAVVVAAAAAAAVVVVVAVACSSGGVMASVLVLPGEFTFAAFDFFSFLLVAFPLPFAPLETIALLLLFALLHDSVGVGEGEKVSEVVLF